MRWTYIILHHTASDIGNLAYYRQLHKARWGDIAYHILINNGSYNSTMGEIEYSKTWERRAPHTSTISTHYNYFGIAIAIVGNFETHPMAPLQEETLVKLLINLAQQYKINPDNIIGHNELQNTKCPGEYIDLTVIREKIRNNLKPQY